MSAKDQISAMLDELMGTSRNGEKSTNRERFDDRSVCRGFLLGCCPWMILAQTKADMGSCNKTHDLALKADYEKAIIKRNDYNFEYDAFVMIDKFVTESDRRKEISKIRLKESQEELGEEAAKKMAKITDIEEEINNKLLKVEEYGNSGDADSSFKTLEEIEDLKIKKADQEALYNNSMPASAYQQQKLRVCDICSAHLGIHDNDRRLVDHFSGKLHLGFIFIREKLEELKTKVEELREKRKHDKETNKETDEIKSRSRSGSRSRRSDSRSGKNKRRTRSRSPRRRSRSRSRDSHRRSRDDKNHYSSRYEKKRRSRSR